MLDFCIRRCQYWIPRFQNCSDGISRIGGRFHDTMADSIGCHDLGDISVLDSTNSEISDIGCCVLIRASLRCPTSGEPILAGFKLV